MIHVEIPLADGQWSPVTMRRCFACISSNSTWKARRSQQWHHVIEVPSPHNGRKREGDKPHRPNVTEFGIDFQLRLSSRAEADPRWAQKAFLVTVCTDHRSQLRNKLVGQILLSVFPLYWSMIVDGRVMPVYNSMDSFFVSDYQKRTMIKVKMQIRTKTLQFGRRLSW